MLLHASDDVEVVLKIEGYEYPNNDRGSYDSNWLRLHVGLVTPHGGWTATRPCVLTWEMEELVAWLHALADNTPSRDSHSFLEPYLRFEVLTHDPEVTTLRMCFEHSGRIEGRTQIKTWADMRLTSDLLHTSAVELNKELQAFPVRGTRSKRKELDDQATV